VRAVAGTASVVTAVALLGVALPAITGVGWSDIGAALGTLRAATLMWLGVLWLAGLWTYTLVLTSSLPGLRHTQALVLNFAGSAVSNVLPFGGAAGAAVTFVMAGSWGHPRRAVAVATVVSGAWNLLSRLALPALGLIVLIASGHLPDGRLTIAVALATGLLVAALALILATLTLDGPNRWVALAAQRVGAVMPARAGGLSRAGEAVSQLRQTTKDVIRRGWIRLTVGMVGYLGLQYLLFWDCLTATSAQVGTGAMIASFALSRLLATTGVTPGGIGVTESGTAALLVALGAAPAPTAAALLLFGFFTHAVEIPVGGLAWVTWATAKRWRVNRFTDPEPTSEDPA
jgi:putative heme transporter